MKVRGEFDRLKMSQKNPNCYTEQVFLAIDHYAQKLVFDLGVWRYHHLLFSTIYALHLPH